jgi:hypothetical protein
MAVFFASAAGVGSTLLVSRHPRELNAMVAQLDEDLLNQVSWLADGPERENVLPFEIMDAIGGRRGLLRLLQQARLMTGITSEAKKMGAQGPELDGMRAKQRKLWRAVGLAMLWPSAQAQKVASIAADMAAGLEDALIQIDAAH